MQGSQLLSGQLGGRCWGRGPGSWCPRSQGGSGEESRCGGAASHCFSEFFGRFFIFGEEKGSLLTI